MAKVRLRFAPSPTGPLHIGGARSALFNYLYAKRHGGDFILRIEDTDAARSSRESEENIKDALGWLGIDWNEGIDVGGPHGPYRQTERAAVYQTYIERLLDKGLAYRCYCSGEELEAMREAQRKAGQMPRYDGRCRKLTDEEEKAYQAEGRKPVIRFRVPDDEDVVIDDAVRGQVHFDSNGIGDFVIVKSDGLPTYNFAVVVDDATMEISHVVRGEEHLSNTPRQMLLYQALAITPPTFAHVSLILGKDRSKMSKRHGSTSVVNYIRDGYLPEGLVNFLVLLGWSPQGEEELFSLEELEGLFDLDRVAKNPAVFDADKLNWVNHQHLQKADLDRLVKLALPYLVEAGYIEDEPAADDLTYVRALLSVVRSGLDYMSQLPQQAELFYRSRPISSPEDKALLSEDYMEEMLTHFVGQLEALELLEPSLVKGCFKKTMKALDLKGKQVFMPVRLALTGARSGPELHELIAVLGLAEVKRRMTENTGFSF